MMKAGETDLAPSERLFVQVGLRVRIQLPPAASQQRTTPLRFKQATAGGADWRCMAHREHQRAWQGDAADASPMDTASVARRNPNDQLHFPAHWKRWYQRRGCRGKWVKQ